MTVLSAVMVFIVFPFYLASTGGILLAVQVKERAALKEQLLANLMTGIPCLLPTHLYG